MSYYILRQTSELQVYYLCSIITLIITPTEGLKNNNNVSTFVLAFSRIFAASASGRYERLIYRCTIRL